MTLKTDLLPQNFNFQTFAFSCRLPRQLLILYILDNYLESLAGKINLNHLCKFRIDSFLDAGMNSETPDVIEIKVQPSSAFGKKD